jgi:TIGR03009 family protein
MKIWIRTIGYALGLQCALSSCGLFAQNGYNTSGNAGQAGQPNQPIKQPGQPNNNPARPQLNPNLNPGLLQGQPVGVPAQDNAKLIVTKDPYAANPISPQEQQYVDQLLDYWENSTKNLERLSCDFKLFEYSSNAPFVQQLAQQTGQDVRQIKYKASQGVVRYMKPDKGMYKVDMAIALTGKLDKTGQPEMLSSEQLDQDYWICDGETIHQYDRVDKKVTHYVIPAELRGQNIMETPLPFLFGIEKVKVKERFWVRALQPPPMPNGQPNSDMFLIEAYPKFQQDAQNYSKVHIYLDRKEFLPLALIKYQTDHFDEPGKALTDSREYFEFSNRVRDANLLQKFNEIVFRQQFIPLQLPAGWTEETKEYSPLATGDAVADVYQNVPAGQLLQGQSNGVVPANPVPGSAAVPPVNGLRK